MPNEIRQRAHRWALRAAVLIYVVGVVLAASNGHWEGLLAMAVIALCFVAPLGYALGGMTRQSCKRTLIRAGLVGSILGGVLGGISGYHAGFPSAHVRQAEIGDYVFGVLLYGYIGAVGMGCLDAYRLR